MVIRNLNSIGIAEKLKRNISIIQLTDDDGLEPELVKRFDTLLDVEKNYHEMLNTKHDLIGDEEKLINTV